MHTDDGSIDIAKDDTWDLDGFTDEQENKNGAFADAVVNFCYRAYNEQSKELQQNLSTEEMVEHINTLGGRYHRADQGSHDTSDGNSLQIRVGNDVTDSQKLRCILREIEFRFAHMALADEYLAMLNIPALDGKSCKEFNTYRYLWNLDRSDEGHSVHAGLFQIVTSGYATLFLDPIHGRPCNKGWKYLIAAFHMAGLSTEEFRRSIGKWV